MAFPYAPKYERMDSDMHSLEEWKTDNRPRSDSRSALVHREGTDLDTLPEIMPRTKRGLTHQLCFLFSLLLGVLWLGPIVYLLIVNIRGDVIGAAAWCPFTTGCSLISYNDQQINALSSLSAQYDEENHNLLGGLQFVAKALEVWFFYIATSLVWYVAVLLARRPGGLPIGYLLTHLEFGDLRALIEPSLYRSAGSKNRPHIGGKRHTLHLYIFAANAVLMCLLANLMGPSVAVLVIPTLHWQSGPLTPNGQFGVLQSALAPSGDDAIPGCNASDLAEGSYACAGNVYGASLDALVQNSLAEIVQNENTPANPDYESTYKAANTAVSLEQSIPFSFNLSAPSDASSSTSSMLWAYSRQVLRGLSSDFEDLYTVVSGNTTNGTKLEQYAQYNNSLNLMLQRQGPMIGFASFAGQGNRTITTVTENQEIRCFEEFSSKTKCFRTGVGWNNSDSFASFVIDKNQTVNLAVSVSAYWSDRSVYIDDGDPCFPNGTLPAGNTCDYDSIFGADVQPLDPGDRMQDIFVLEYSLPTSNVAASTLVVESFMYYGFTTYSIDVTNVWPSLRPAEVTNPPSESDIVPMVMHPAWVLAAWNIEDGGNLEAYRNAPLILQGALTEWASQANGRQIDTFGAVGALVWNIAYTMGQAASLVSFNTTATDSLDSTAPNPDAQPVLTSNVYYNIWGWAIDSRTSKLGIAVVVLGGLAAIARTILMLIIRERSRTSLELVATALEHTPRGELAGVRGEVELAQVRYRLVHAPGDETLRLQPVRAVGD